MTSFVFLNPPDKRVTFFAKSNLKENDTKKTQSKHKATYYLLWTNTLTFLSLPSLWDDTSLAACNKEYTAAWEN